MDAELPIPQLRTMDDIVNGSVAQRRFQMNLILLFAAAAIILASLGIYGVMSYAVVQRTNEIGIRIALGADRASVLRMTLLNALQLVGAGLVMGIPLAFGATSVLRASLFGVSPSDSMTLSGTCLLITTIALLAAYVPARRASRTDPMTALRFE
jgi:ABC-type antimicrobial peptide transport system permease subunit